MQTQAEPQKGKRRETSHNDTTDRLYNAESRTDINPVHPEVQASLDELRQLQAKSIIADAEKAKALSAEIKGDVEIDVDESMIDEKRSTEPPTPPMGRDQADDAYFAKIAKRLDPGELSQYKSIYAQYEGIVSNLEGAGMLEKRKLNARKAALEKELTPYWDKIQRYDEFRVLKENTTGPLPELDQEVMGQLSGESQELVSKAMAAEVPGLKGNAALDEFAAKLLQEEQLVEAIDSAKGFMGFFKRASAENKLKNLRANLVPLKEAVMSSKGTSGSNLDARRMGRAAQ